jgi:hypothetical protein
MTSRVDFDGLASMLRGQEDHSQGV